jgi:flavin-dependent dehydrogenase
MEHSQTIRAKTWDVVIAGGRCAGAATAIRFARSGRSVLMIDKVGPYRNTLSSHLLMPWAVARLGALGIRAELSATGAPPVRTFVVEFDGHTIRIPMGEPTGYALCVRRTTLDPLLVKAAQNAGVTVRHGVSVADVVRDEGRVCGVVLRGPEGDAIERARIVIGADGRRSTIARKVEAEEYGVVPSPTGVFYSYFAGISPAAAGPDTLQFSSGPSCEVLCAPCDGGLHVVLLVVAATEFGQINSGGTDAYLARLKDVPAFAARLAHARQVERLFPASPVELRGFFRKPFGPGWALVGDAAYHSHPAPANGIADALRGAELLHGAVERAWSLDMPAETFLSGYHATRDAENAGPYAYSYRLGAVNPFNDPDVMAVISALARRRTTPRTSSHAA